MLIKNGDKMKMQLVVQSRRPGIMTMQSGPCMLGVATLLQGEELPYCCGQFNKTQPIFEGICAPDSPSSPRGP